MGNEQDMITLFKNNAMVDSQVERELQLSKTKESPRQVKKTD